MDITAEIQRYVSKHAGTIRGFDMVAGTSPNVLSPELVIATRKVSSRISNAELEWFVDKGSSAPWDAVGLDEGFADADVLEVHGLYDRATNLWNYFAVDSPRGIADAKISKVLFLMRPNTFPIIDSRLTKRYRPKARELWSSVYQKRPELRGSDLLTWEAFRRDLLKNQERLDATRGELTKGNELEVWVGKNASDLRLLDMIAWQE